jgi:hypothetical protein
MPAAGSSSSSIFGLSIIARAISRRRWLPYDSDVETSSAIPSSLKIASSFIARRASRLVAEEDGERRSAAPSPALRVFSQATSTFSSTVSLSEEADVLERPRDADAGDLAGLLQRRRLLPSKRMLNPSGLYTPVTRLNTVVLPAPFGPMSRR